MKANATRFIRRDHGQSMIEFAIVLPILLVVVLGLVEVSWALYDQHVVTKTRYLVHGKVDDRPAGAEAQVRDQMDDAHGQLRLVITRRERG